MTDFEFVGNQPALVCHRREGLVQLLEVDFLAILEGLSQRQWPPPGITVTTVTLPPLLPPTNTTPLARNRTTNDTMTTALRTPTSTAIISMHREHLLSIGHIQKFLPHQVDAANGQHSLRVLPFFISQSDPGFKGEFLPKDGEAERQISFSQSLMTAMPEMIPCPRSLFLLRTIVKGEGHTSLTSGSY